MDLHVRLRIMQKSYRRVQRNFRLIRIRFQIRAAQQSEDTSFYGIWCYGSKEEGEANSYAETLKASGFDTRVYVTTDWSNLNTEKFYVVTAGVYSTESEANANLTSVQSVCQEAYVKYSGNYMG